MDRPRITATISVVFQEEHDGDFASRSNKRRRKSTIFTRPPQVSKISLALPVKSGTQTSSSEGNGIRSYAHLDKQLQGISSTSSSENNTWNPKEDDEDVEDDYRYPIVEEVPPSHTNS